MTSVPPTSTESYVVRRTAAILDEPEEFIEELLQRLRELASEIGLDRQGEPIRLLDAQEYRAAVISAMTQFEAFLRRQLDGTSVADLRRPLSMSQLVELAVARQLISTSDAQRIRNWMKIRNAVVHTNLNIGRQQAKEIVEGVSLIVRRR